MSLNSPFRQGKKHVEEAPYVPSLGTAVFDSHYKTVEYNFSPQSSSASSCIRPISAFSCGACGKEASEKVQLVPCKNCHRRYHCNVFCQIADWSKNHGKSICQKEKHTANFITAVTNLEPSNAAIVLKCLEKLHTKYEKHKPNFPTPIIVAVCLDMFFNLGIYQQVPSELFFQCTKDILRHHLKPW